MSEGLYTDFLLSYLQTADENLYGYALFDGVKHPSLYKELQKSSLEYDTLFTEESLRSQLKEVAPYMIKLDFNKKRSSQESKQLLEHCEKEEALLLTSSLGFKKQLEKMQNIFHLTDEEGNIESYLRFYDSQIFDALTKTQDEAFLSHLFQDTPSYWLQDEICTTVITQYDYKESVVSTKSIDLLQSKGN
jgi:hypothetical protein